MLTDILSFLKDKYDQLPQWVKVPIYIVLFVVFIYLLLAPNYLDGELVTKVDEKGGETPFRRVPINMYANGRLIKMVTSEDGLWTIPLASKMPFKSVEISFYVDDKKHPVTIPYKNVISGSVKIVYNEDSDTPFVIAYAENNRSLFAWHAQSAYAQDLCTNSTTFNTADNLNKIILASVQSVLRGTNTPVCLNDKIKSDLHISDARFSSLCSQIERKLNVRIADEEWAKVISVRDIVDLVKRHL